MPIYEYECRNHHRFDIKQSFSDAPKAECPTCEAPAKRVLNVPAVIYKGSGFYTTDYARASARSENGDGAKKDEAKSEAKGETKAESKNGAAAESKESGTKAKAETPAPAAKTEASKDK